MNKKRILSLFIIGLMSFSTFAQGKLFIIGGGKRPPELIKRLTEEAKLKEGYGIVLSMSSSEPDTSAYYGVLQFKKQGFDNVSFMFYTTEQPPTSLALDSIRKASLIYITGGDQNRFMKRIEKTGIYEAIHDCYKNGGMIAGTSAGAAVMSEVMITGDEKNYPDYDDTGRSIESNNLIYGKGLGMINKVIIDQHFIQRSRYNRLMTAVIDHPKLRGIGIDESTAILVHQNEFEVVGVSQVILIEKPQQIDTKDTKIGARKISVSILKSGDKIKL
ncbi:cyanophycinase [Flammeovirga yaeyamensis]|uniref:Cyanophycinase n=1 Tax=Flammeovirga yaeyamensis TaxID=367791 RepID=A0AAX1N9K2_9BACT|nr:cyanophycinase [Flammeovirga yaeyamensis]MBB3699466.1 cyanophycinase [Flammeovirga yaeyamensis]NMF35277.1 cyanophycinase [Flammeovirga yaeyamensis]QWG04137.1 cyanophycinase [Flammeovirga yaeyamensis]